MSGTVRSPLRRTRGSAASGTSTVERHALLQSAARGNRRAISQICDRHGTALLHLAHAVVADPVRAEAVVVEVVARACADPITTATAATGSLRRELARLTYLYSSRERLDVDPPQPGSALDRMAQLSQTARQQRAAIALVQCGDHGVDDVADLLGLSLPAVAVLLTSGLRDLEAVDRRPATTTKSRRRLTAAPTDSSQPYKVVPGLIVDLTDGRSAVGMITFSPAQPDGFTTYDLTTAYLIAVHASLAIAAIRTTQNLSAASDAAFALLRCSSQDNNTRFQDVARSVTTTRHLPGEQDAPAPRKSPHSLWSTEPGARR